jgi:hypothetical protein
MWRSRREIRRATRGIHPLIFQGNRMMRDGSFEAAAGMFEQAAGLAEMRGNGRSPNLYILAGRARLLAGQNDAGMKLIYKALGEMKNSALMGELEITGRRLVNSIRQAGFENEAAGLAAWLEENLQQPGLASTIFNSELPKPDKKVVLPVQCPACGAPIDSTTIEWADSLTAVCSFCGRSIRGEAF